MSQARYGLSLRIFLTVWLVYAAHATTNVVRETYLAISLGESFSLRVDPYLGLHPDLFEVPGRGVFINSNPGASMAGAPAYALARPIIGTLFKFWPGLAAPKPPSRYEDPRPNRTEAMNAMRARGLDVKLALAALATQFGLMAPAGAAAAVLVFLFLRARLRDERKAMWLALLYAFGTPIFFRSAFLNQNALLAHLVLLAFLLAVWRPSDAPLARDDWRDAGIGLCMGLGLLCDYSAAPLALIFGGWVLARGFLAGRLRGMGLALARFLAGAVGPLAILFLYQWIAFGSPWFPAQRYMPATPFSVLGWNGLTLPTADLLFGNLFDPRFGLFVFSPLLVLGLVVPVVRRGAAALDRPQTAVVLLATSALWVFSSANQFANLQWNTGVRYLVPAVPLLFLAAVPVLLGLPVWARLIAVVPSVIITWAVSMTREDVPTALRLMVTDGPAIPVLIVLRKTAAAYAPFLARGTFFPGVAVYLLLALILWGLWKGVGTSRGRAVRPQLGG